MITRNNNVKISIMIIVGVRQYRALSEQLMHVSRKCVGLKFDMNRFLDNLSKLNCQDSSQYKSACQKNNWILYFCCNCDRHVALLFKVDGSDKKKNQYWLVCSFYRWKSFLTFMKYETLGSVDSIFATCPWDHNYNVGLFS